MIARPPAKYAQTGVVAHGLYARAFKQHVILPVVIGQSTQRFSPQLMGNFAPPLLRLNQHHFRGAQRLAT